MSQNILVKSLVVILVLALSATTALAEVTLEIVPVGNQGNAADVTGYGAVGYAYNIGAYEVTAGQYVEFLNAVAATDTYGLYNASMNSDSEGCQITQNGSSGSYTYDFSGRPSGTAADWQDRPVNYVSWGDAARFANWLHNGQPGLVTPVSQDLNSTENGAYYLDGAITNEALIAVSRVADWKWSIPSEDEWYKAAYHKNDGDTGNYFDYPTSSDNTSAPLLSKDLIDPDPGNNATFYATAYTIGSPYYRTEVGAHENSESPYDTFDQGGNLWEWNDAVISGSSRGARGGYYYYFSDGLAASHRIGGLLPSYELKLIGFRVASIPEPGSITLLLCGLLSLICLRRKI